ncbi:MAG: FAD/NAD(P)-binding protein [Pseudomonadota bacterium]
MGQGTSSDRPRRHAVVGDGITAAAFVETCQLSAGDELIVIGPRVEGLGRGIAYAAEPDEVPWRHAYLLNSPADDIDPEFARWLAANWEGLRDRMEGRRPDWLGAAAGLLEKGDTYGLNAPRAFYGDFMDERMGSVIAALRNRGVTVTLIADAVTALSEDAGGLTLTTQTGRTITADAVDIAPGGPSTQRFDGDNGPFSAPTLFGNEARIAEHIKAGAEIFCVGANATMLDALRLCQSLIPEEKIRFVACSSDGGLPAPLIPRLPRYLTKPDLKPGHGTAETFLADVADALKKARSDGDQMREMRAGFRAYFIENGLSSFLTDDAEARKVPRTLRHWFRGGTRDTIGDFHRLMAVGRTRTLPGRVVEIEATDSGARVVTQTREGGTERHDTGFVINCAGAGRGSLYDPLTEHLLAKGWIRTCPISGGLEVGARCATALPGVRHLSPATTVIGAEVMPMPLYDAHLLRTWAARANAA